MTTQLRALDSFCCEGGVSVGTSRAGFDVYGLDLFEDYSQKRYPFASHKGDALVAFDILLTGDALPFTEKDGTVVWLSLADFDLLLASPPCQHATVATSALRAEGKEYVRLIEPTREALIATGKPYIIENVQGADLRDPITLCGCMFDLSANDEDGLPLRMERQRLFESNMPLEAPRPCDHDPKVWVAGCYGGARRWKRPEDCTKTLAELAPLDRHEAKYVRKGGYVPRSKRVQQELLGIDWMTLHGMHQSIPPIYSHFLASQARDYIEGGVQL